MHRPGLDEITKMGGGIDLLAQRNRRIDRLRQTAMALDIVKINGFLDPGDVEIFQAAGRLDGLRQIPAADSRRS